MVKPIVVRDNKTDAVKIINTAYDSTTRITMDVVRESVRRYHAMVNYLEKEKAPSFEFKHLSIEYDEMCKQIITSLGDLDYIKSLISEIERERIK